MNYGLRYEFFAPYTEKYGRLAEVLTNPTEGFTTQTEVLSGQGGLPASLVYPFHKAFAPRVGIALRVPKLKQTVVRAGFGINYTVGSYATFATTMAHQPPYANEQTNQEITAQGTPTAGCVQTGTCLTLADGFPAPATVGNYALDPHFRLPYVQTWNLDIQKTLPWGIVMNVGYNGSKGNHLDIVTAPRALAISPETDPTNLIFRYEQAAAFYKFTAGTLRVNKRLSGGISLGANYQYSHAIDNAGAVGAVGGVGAQNWTNLLDEEGNSSLDLRHKVSGTYLYELPFRTGQALGDDRDGFAYSGGLLSFRQLYVCQRHAADADICRGVGQCGVRHRRHSAAGPDRVAAETEHGPAMVQSSAFSEPSSNPQFPCGVFGNAPRNFITGPGTVQNNMALSKTMQLGETRSLEIPRHDQQRVQYGAVLGCRYQCCFTYVWAGDVGGTMRSFQFTSRFRF